MASHFPDGRPSSLIDAWTGPEMSGMEQDALDIGDTRIAVWPTGQELANRGDPAVIGTRFDDAGAYSRSSMPASPIAPAAKARG